MDWLDFDMKWVDTDSKQLKQSSKEFEGLDEIMKDLCTWYGCVCNRDRYWCCCCCCTYNSILNCNRHQAKKQTTETTTSHNNEFSLVSASIWMWINLFQSMKLQSGSYYLRLSLETAYDKTRQKKVAQTQINPPSKEQMLTKWLNFRQPKRTQIVRLY